MSITEEERATVAKVAASLGALPPDEPEAAANVQAKLLKYEQRYQEEMRAGIRKGLNMVVPKEVVGDNVVTVFGHVPGVKPGAKFKDRGGLYVAGVHATLMKGIHAPPAKHPDYSRGAYSVVMSGGYIDDEDMGESFWYTGEGGIDKNKRQVKDQSFDTGSNAALRNNCDTLTPVRVIRGYVSGGEGGGGGGGEEGGAGGGGGGKREKGFVYEGLYLVLQYKQEPSKDGPLVCKFLLCGLPGHSTVNTKVEFGIFGGAGSASSLSVRRLAGGAGGGQPHPAKRARQERDRRAAEAIRAAMLEEIRRRYPPSVLLSEDISGGQEPVPIPLLNELSREQLPAGFQYTREYVWAPGVYELVAPVLAFADEEMREFTRAGESGQCGVAFNRMIRAKDLALGDKLPKGYEPHMEEQYNSAGCLMVTDPCGVHECGETCTSAACRRNKQLSQGVALPLEVFMTASKGWGVRCREDIPAGAFVCCYVGQLVTDSMAEVRKGADHYLFDLDFFTHVYAEIKEKGLDAIKEEIPVHKIPPVPNMELVRQIQANAAAAVRAARQREAATATTATVEASSAAAKGAAAAGSAAASGGPASAASGPDVGVSEGVMAPAEVAAAARGLLASCRAIAAADDSGAAAAAAAAGPSSAAAPMTAEAATAAPAALGGSAAKCAALQSAAATAAEAAAEDPGAFYLQPIFSRDEAGVPAGAAGTSSEGAVEGADGDEYAPVLVIDAQGTGNVGRFINHSCSGNLTIQAVFAGHFRNTMLYHVGLYAMENIPKFAELTYNYGYHSKSSQAGRDGVYGMKCCCGHPQCIGQLM